MEDHVPEGESAEVIYLPDEKIEEKPEPEVGKTIYPHTGIALIQIAKVWAILGLMVGGILWAQAKYLPPEVYQFANLACFLLVVGGALFAVYTILHYTNTYVEITKDAIIYRRGWIPHSTDTIFWVHIKDINSSASVTESLLRTGSITILVAIRNNLVATRMSYLPNHEEFADYIRKKIGRFSDATRQVTYT
jgi:membrane protein YdbS with pleckstrin-like domain